MDKKQFDGARLGLAALALAFTAAPALALAQVPAPIEAQLKEIGRIVAPADTAKLYRPLFGDAPPAGVTITRDISFGPTPKQVLNVYAPPQAGKPRRVLIFVPGGQGVKQMGGPEGTPFYDNIGGWGVNNGLVVVTTQYRTGGPSNWDDGAKDVGATLAWARANIAKFGGDPAQIVLWGQSNGANQTANYLGHPELQGPEAAGLKGAILMSGSFDILPLEVTGPPLVIRTGAPAGAPAGPPPAAPDPAVQLQRSDLPGLKASKVPLLLIASEIDPQRLIDMLPLLGKALTDAGHAPKTYVIPMHSHISEVTSVGTADQTASAPVLAFVREAR
jgi:acetyl esterase/lipase